MSYSTRILPGLVLLLAAVPAAGDGVDHYELAPSVMRANGQAIYPAGVNDPSLANLPGPTPDRPIPVPPTAGPSAGTAPTGPSVWSPNGPASSNLSPPGTVGAGPWSPPAVVQTQVYPAAPATAVAPAAPAVNEVVPPVQASWYTRVEYFHWNERIGSTDFVNEDGTLFTLGYSRQIGIERFRAELFGGDVHYDGYAQLDPGLVSMTSNTGYLGLRGEYEMVLAPAVWEGRFALLMGVGSRFWIRDLHDASDSQGDPVQGYQESWWTMYPYLGLETHRRLGSDLDFYSESRIGTTASTYEFASIGYRPLWPKAGLLANTEIGLRGSWFFIAARAEVMTWAQSSVVQDAYQPNSLMVTAGGRLGILF
jgi:hypothetical protein